MKKSASALALFMFLSVVLFSCSPFLNFVSAFFYFPEMPSHSIEITKDGNVTGTDKIQRDGNVYTFLGDIVGNIVVFRSDIIVDGAGYTLQGNGGGTGLWFQEKNNVEIKNLQVRNFHSGMVFTWGLYSSTGCKNITLSRNTIADNQYGITFTLSGNNHVLGNTIANNTYGISITPEPNNTFRNNQLTNNLYSFWLECTERAQVANYINDIDESNTIDGKPIIYWVDEQDKIVPSDAGYVALVKCRNITVQNLVLVNNSPGILLVDTSNSHITNNHIATAIAPRGYGLVLLALDGQCVGNTITENTITNNQDGILSWDAEGTIITGNNITNNQERGIYFYDSNGSIISGNTISANSWSGIYIWGLHYPNNNTISGNRIENNKSGMVFEYACNSTVTGNNITSNAQWGLVLNYDGFYNRHYGFYPVSNNTFYHNNFVNDQQVLYSATDQTDKNLTIDNWDNGFEGNYWSNYNGTDNNGDGIGETAYILNENNQDNHPLMVPSKIFDAGTWEWTQYNVDIISNSAISDFSFNPQDASIRFDVEGEDRTIGFCRITIPKDLLDAEDNWVVLVDDNPVIPSVDEDEESTYIYFTFTHASKTVEIIGTDAIPEFASLTPLLITLVSIIAVTVIYRRKLHNRGRWRK